jgi:cytochrome c biogenesis factor
VALFEVLCAAVAAIVGARRASASLLRTAGHCLAAAAVLTLVATLGLVSALVRSDFSVRFVAEHSARNLPLGFRVAALWSGDAGALLLAALVASAGAAVAARSKGALGGAPRSIALIVVTLGLLVLLGAALVAQPFERLPFLPSEGEGLPPQFQSLAGAARPLATLVGVALWLVPLGLALQARRSPQREGREVPGEGARKSERALTPWLLAGWAAQHAAVTLGIWLALREPPVSARGGLATVAPWLSTTVWVLLTAATRRALLQWRAVWAVAAGAALIVASLAARAAEQRYAISLGAGETTTVRDAFGAQWTFTQQGISVFRRDNREIVAATLEGARNAGRRVLLAPARLQSVDSSNEPLYAPRAAAAVNAGLFQDVIAVLQSTSPAGAARVEVAFRPLASWAWLGCLLLLAGSLWAWVRSLTHVP